MLNPDQIASIEAKGGKVKKRQKLPEPKPADTNHELKSIAQSVAETAKQTQVVAQSLEAVQQLSVESTHQVIQQAQQQTVTLISTLEELINNNREAKGRGNVRLKVNRTKGLISSIDVIEI
jgi:negative regulator of replication initiation